MKAVRIHEFGGPEVMKLEDVPVPSPDSDEVLIKIKAASVNPVDGKIREGKYPPVTQRDLPYTLGRDAAGEIAAVGDKVQGFAVGENLFVFLDPKRGGYQEYVLAKVSDIAYTPGNLGAEQAAGIPLAGITAWQGLFDHGGLKAGQRVLIHAGAGGVGHLAVQFAKAKGAWVATTVSAKDTEFARSLGADLVIDYKKDRFEDLVGKVDLVYDLIADETQTRSFDVLERGGALISTLQQPDEVKAKEYGVRVGRYTAQPNGEQLGEIARLIDDGSVRIVVGKVFALDEFKEAQASLENDHVQGKVVLRVV
jgi:NADPH:quinone reductase-like Zn-dependent oxidoreductase